MWNKYIIEDKDEERSPNMSTQKQELYHVIETLPEELAVKVLEYIEYLKFVSITNNAPHELIIENEEDFISKVEEGIQDVERGNVCTIDEAFSEIEKCL